MLARAIVVELRWRAARAQQRGVGCFVPRRMNAAFKIRFAEADLGEPGRDLLDMRGLTAVGGAGQGQFLRAKADSVRRAGLDQRQGLDRLQGGTGIYEAIDVA